MTASPLSLVTGGAGFIGSHVTDELIERGHRVIVLDDLSGGFRHNVNERADFVVGSITDAALIERLFSDHAFDYVFHLAAYAAEGLSHFIKRFNYENNLIGSVNLINASVNAGTVKRFVFTSSIAVYGPGQVPMREESVPEPEDPYGIAKYAVEQDLHCSLRLFGLPYTIFRPHNVYGERQHIGDRYRNVVGIFMNNIMKGQPLPVFGDGQQSRAFTYIGDIAPIIAESAQRPEAENQTFNIGADSTLTVMELAQAVAKAMGVKPDIQYLPARFEVKHAFSTHDKIRDVLGFKAATTIEEGLQRMAGHVLEQGPQTGQKFSHIEIMKNLPPHWLKD